MNGNVVLRNGSEPVIGQREGRVEICYENVYHSICDDFWNLNDAQVVCRQLGAEGDGKRMYRNKLNIYVKTLRLLPEPKVFSGKGRRGCLQHTVGAGAAEFVAGCMLSQVFPGKGRREGFVVFPAHCGDGATEFVAAACFLICDWKGGILHSCSTWHSQ